MNVCGKNCEIRKLDMPVLNVSTKNITQRSLLVLPLINSARSGTSNKNLNKTGTNELKNKEKSIPVYILRKNYSFTNLVPFVSASGCCVLDLRTEKVLFSKNDSEVKEIASLGKIMTCYLSLKICETFKISLDAPVKISTKATKLVGTSAELIEDSISTVKDLLYGLMLPSGNDAAWSLAEYFGSILNSSTWKPVKQFVQEMNKTAQSMGLTGTSFKNPHGLSFKRNLSTARDVSFLTAVALKDQTFRDIVGAQIYHAEFRGKNSESIKRTWLNTNKLLIEGFQGVKTGVTNNAGPCLCALYQNVLIILLNSRSLETRWVEAKKLANWATFILRQQI